MSMVVRNNLSAINTLNTLNRNHTALAKSLQTVSSGMRINSAKDDASGYAISERMRVQIRSLNQDNNNTQNGHSMMKVAEGAVQSTVDILKTLKEKVINAANDTNTDADRAQIQKELDQSIDQINDNANVTYNGKYLVDGSKNAKSNGTRTALTNSSLSTSTTAGWALTRLQDRSGQNLNIQAGDRVTVSFVTNGQTYSTSFSVTNASTLATIMSKAQLAGAGQVFQPSDQAQADTLWGLYQTAKSAYETYRDGTLETKKTAYTTYTNAQNNLSSALSRLDGKASDSALRAYTSLTHTFGQDYSDWKDAHNGLSGYSTPASATTATYRALRDVLESPGDVGVGAAATAFANSFTSDYTVAYNALKSLDDAKSLADRQSEYEAAQTQANILKDAMDTAYGNWEATSAPEIKTTSTIGTDYFGKTVETADKQNALTITAAATGVTGQIAGFTICVTDAQGNINKSANAKLDAWNETIRAENARTEDYAIVLQTGTKANQAIKIRLTDMRAQALGLQGEDGSTLNVGTQKNANAAINVLDNAIQKALDQQTTIGAIESRLEYTSTNLTTATENVTASESTLRDADMAKAMTEYTKNNILAQSSQAMLAQANQSSNQVLSLLR